jgi:hypothetical protein
MDDVHRVNETALDKSFADRSHKNKNPSKSKSVSNLDHPDKARCPPESSTAAYEMFAIMKDLLPLMGWLRVNSQEDASERGDLLKC